MKVLTLVVAGAALAGCTPEWEEYTKIERSEPQPIAGIANADFEDSTKFGMVKENGQWSKASVSKPNDVEYGRFGYNGNGGCRLHTHGKFRVFDFASIQLKKDRTYTFSVMIKRGKKGWGNAAWAIFENGKYRSERGGIVVEELSDGWVRSAVTFTPTLDGPGVENRLHFQGGGPEGGYIDFDNLKVIESVPTWNSCLVWPIHNTVYSEQGRFRCHNAFVGAFFETNAAPFYVMRLVKGDGSTLAETVCPAKAGTSPLTGAFGRLDYNGPAKLVAALYDRQNRLAYGTREVEVTVAPTLKPKAGRAFITEDGRTLVDGKPFMPLGFWTGFADYKKNPKEDLPRKLKELSDAGFNAIVEYDGYLLRHNKADRDYFYEQCAKYGIRVFAGECGVSEWNSKDPEIETKWVKKVQPYVDYPAIFAWFMADEVSADRVGDLAAARRILNRETPGIPTWPCNIFDPEPFLPGEDAVGGDFYPYRGRDNSDLLTQDRRLARIEACQPAVAWIAPQCYNWGNQKRQKGVWKISVEDYLKSEPNENNMLANALHMASRGITGFLFYSYFDMLRTPEKEPTLPAKRWESMKSIAKTFKSLEPFITSGLPREELKHTDVKGSSRVVALFDGKGNRRVLIIGLDKDNVCEIDAAELKGTSLRSRCGLTTIKDGKATFAGKAVSGDVIE